MIKKTIFILCFISGMIVCSAQPDISGISFPPKVNVYDLYEISFNLGSYANPYDPKVIDVFAVFQAPNGKSYRVNGFYYEGYNFMEKNGVEVASRNGDEDCWKIRFTPDVVGKWTYVVHAVDRGGAVQLSSYNGDVLAFECQAKDAEGFVRKANAKYLKRETFVNGQRRYRPFFPIGPNVAWYSSADYNKFKKPYGIYEYKSYIDSLAGNANYMRVWLNRYQCLSLYGPEHAIRDNGKPVMYFDSDLNQKDAAEFDFIVSYAAEHGIILMPCIFTYDDFRDDSEALDNSMKYNSMPSGWRYNPFHTVLGLERPLDFFSNPNAIRISRNLIRYIVARWGYATNILCWELWNELDNIFKGETLDGKDRQALIDWHAGMSSFFSVQDPHEHLVTTSTVPAKGNENLSKDICQHLDFVQRHYYQNIQKAKSREQVSQRLLEVTRQMRDDHPSKPAFIGEFGFGGNAKKITVNDKDPYGVDLHNSLWSSLFAGSVGPASFWRWPYLKANDLFRSFCPVLNYSKAMPLLSDAFVAETTGEAQGSDMVFPNGLETYYLINAAEDSIYGWSQDAAFRYQSLRRLTDEVDNTGHFVDDSNFDPQGYIYTLDKTKRPGPSSKDNTIEIPVANQPRRTRYLVRWFDGETGLEMPNEETTAVVRRKRFRNVLEIQFPSSIRDVKKGVITNTFGDAAFMVTKISD